MAKKAGVNSYMERTKVSRPGVHAKSKHSNHKSSKLYKKLSRGQGGKR